MPTPVRSPPPPVAEEIDPGRRAADLRLALAFAEIDRIMGGVPAPCRESIRAQLQQRAVSAWIFDVAMSQRGGVRGYVPPPSPPPVPRPPPAALPPGKAPAKTPASTSGGSKDFAFLHDKKMSIEDKLFNFMMAVQKRTDRELQDAMERYEKQYVKSGSSSSGSTQAAKKDDGGGGILGFLGGVLDVLGTVCPPVAIARKALGELGISKVVSQLTGPILASLCTAWGVPTLAPAALKLGPDLAQAVLGDDAPEKPQASSSGSSGSSGASETDADERYELMKLQRLVEKQQQMFTLVSNLLKVMHDTGMNAIHNIR